MIDKDLEKAARKYTKKNTCYNPDPDLLRSSTKEAFIAGAKWQAEQDDRDVIFWKGMQYAYDQLLKESVEGEVVKDINNKLAVTAKGINLDGFKFGDKVKIIVLKEEQK